MATFYKHPVNMSEDQTDAAVISDRNLRTSSPAGTFMIVTGSQMYNAVFVISSGATSVNTFTASTPSTDTNYYLKEISGRQYTLHHFANTVGDFTLTVVGGRVYRALVLELIHRFDPNQFFRTWTPSFVDRTGIKQESLRGNISIQRRSGTYNKREIQYTSAFTDKSDRDMFRNIHNEYPNFTYSENPKLEYDAVFPAVFADRSMSSPYGGPYWEGGFNVSFGIQEQ